MPLYRRKPITEDAIQWQQGDFHSAVTTHANGRSYLSTSRGPLQLQSGDWIIRTVLGDHMLMPPGLFSLTYESAEVSQ